MEALTQVWLLLLGRVLAPAAALQLLPWPCIPPHPVCALLSCPARPGCLAPTPHRLPALPALPALHWRAGDVPGLQGRAARLPAQGRQVAHLSVVQRPQRHPGRPDGAWLRAQPARCGRCGRCGASKELGSQAGGGRQPLRALACGCSQPILLRNLQPPDTAAQGLGKTVQTIGFLCHLRNQGHINGCDALRGVSTATARCWLAWSAAGRHACWWVVHTRMPPHTRLPTIRHPHPPPFIHTPAAPTWCWARCPR